MGWITKRDDFADVEPPLFIDYRGMLRFEYNDAVIEVVGLNCPIRFTESIELINWKFKTYQK